MSVDDLKRAAAEAAVAAEVGSGTAIGLGSGSTAAHVVRAIARRLGEGVLRDVVCVPTSSGTAALATSLGVPLATLDEQPALAVAIDGADEIGPGLALVKGLGGALLREKVVASAAARFVVVADGTKLVDRLGAHAPLPVEVIAFALAVATPALAALGCEPVLRRGPDGTPFTTDEGNRIVDCAFPGGITDASALGRAIHDVPGVVEHGLFVGVARAAYVASAGGVEVIAAAP